MFGHQCSSLSLENVQNKAEKYLNKSGLKSTVNTPPHTPLRNVQTKQEKYCTKSLYSAKTSFALDNILKTSNFFLQGWLSLHCAERQCKDSLQKISVIIID